MLTKKLWSMAQLGAEWVLYVLILLSVISIAIMLERLFFFLRYRMDIETTQQRLHASLVQGGPEMALRKFSNDSSPETVVLCDALRFASSGSAAVQEIGAGARGQQKLRLERGLSFLGTLGNNAPFIGLFGTVLGIINAFGALGAAQLSQAGPQIMAAISEALVATAVGLLVAIPAVVAFNYFQRQIKRVLTQTDTLLHVLQAFLHSVEELDPVFEEPALPPDIHAL